MMRAQCLTVLLSAITAGAVAEEERVGPPGACCHVVGGSLACQNLSESACLALSPPRMWQVGQQCGAAAQYCPHIGCLEATGSCFSPHALPGCERTRCCDEVCIIDDFCCIVEWDGACVSIADLSCECGNGTPDAGEECDDGNDLNTDECLNSCEDAVCGDTFLWMGVEQCDDGNTSNNDGCDELCNAEPGPEVCPTTFGTEFNFQGQLVLSGAPVNNDCEFQFALWDAESDGNAVGGGLTRSASVVDGQFAVSLDFGQGAFDGESRWLNITVQCTGDPLPSDLSPRTPVLPAPYSMVAAESCGWGLAGNSGIVPGTNFVGTTDGRPLELRAVGVGINRSNPSHPFHVGSGPFNGNGAHLTAGGVWTNGSDRDTKHRFETVDEQDILRRLSELPVAHWQFKGEPRDVRHIGPMAQDFHAAFNLGGDERYIGTLDADGVALAAIKGLNHKLSEANQRISALESRISNLDRRRNTAGSAAFVGLPFAVIASAGWWLTRRRTREVAP